MKKLLFILLFILAWGIPAVGIFTYYSHYDILFYISSILCAIVWLLGLIFSFKEVPFAGVIVLVVPLALAFFLHQADGYNMLLLASCFGVYLTYLFVYLYGKALGHWSIWGRYLLFAVFWVWIEKSLTFATNTIN